MHQMLRVLLTLALLASFAVFSPARVHAQETIQVTNLGDACPAEPDTLRAAINTATNNTGSWVIEIEQAGTINLQCELPILTGNISIINTSGGNVTLRRDVDEAFRVLTIIGGSTNITIEGLTISNGGGVNDGGGIFVNLGPKVTIRDSTISGNHATADVQARGGGLLVSGANTVVTVINSTIENNSVKASENAWGGGVHVVAAGTLEVTNSTIANNQALEAVTASGGGIRISSIGKATITNSTIAFNSIPEGLGPGSGISNNGSSTIINGSIIAGNTGDANCGGSLDDAEFNLSEDGIGPCSIADVTLDEIGFDPLGLAMNGGPTETIMLLPGSPAIDAIPNNHALCTGTGQNGIARPRGHGCDIGAVEVEFVPSFVVTNPNDSGPGSLRQAILDANLTPGHQTITFDYDFANEGPVTLTSGQLEITTDIAIEGPGADVLTVQRSYADDTETFRIFEISGDIEVTIEGLTINNGLVAGQGGGIAVMSGATLTIQNATISGNKSKGQATARGGGIYLDDTGTHVKVVNSAITSNHADGVVTALGGGIYAAINSRLEVINSTIVGNQASASQPPGIALGGGIRTNMPVNSTIINSTIAYNSVAGGGPDGSGIANSGTGLATTLTVRGSIIASNIGAPNCHIDVVDDPFIDDGFNLVEDDGSCSEDGVTLADIGLAEDLAMNGGTTPTLMLQPGSLAVDAGGDDCPATDQRGSPRPAGDACDIGAVEAQIPTITVPDDMIVTATSPQGATVEFDDDVAATSFDGSPADYTCIPPSGALFDVGTETVTCTAPGEAGHVATTTFAISVVAPDEPTITIPDDMTVTATSQLGAPVDFDVSAVDADGQPLDVDCTWSPGSTFPIGTTTVTCTAEDNFGQTVQDSFTVTVVIPAGPTIDLPDEVIVETGNPDGAPVAWDASATDAFGNDLSVTCSLESGSFLAVGTYRVTCAATDRFGQEASGSFDVAVVYVGEMVPPRISKVLNTNIPAAGPDGTVVVYNLNVWSPIDPNPVVVCVPPSGSLFPLGTTTVTCTATDRFGNVSSVTFTITIFVPQDTEPGPAPGLTLPGDLTVNATSPAGAEVSYAVGASAGATVVCSPAPGAVMPIGTTTITCTATGGDGQTASGSFEVRVLGAMEQLRILIDEVAAEDEAAAVPLVYAGIALNRGWDERACGLLDTFIEQTGESQWADDARRIRSVIGCV